MRKTLKRRARKNRTRKGGVSLANRFRGLFSRTNPPVNNGSGKNVLDPKPKKNILNPNNNREKKNRAKNNQGEKITAKPILKGSNVIDTINPNIVRRYPGNQGPNYVTGFRPPPPGPRPIIEQPPGA